jgi:uncharacterized RDD family membrane protein YckC
MAQVGALVVDSVGAGAVVVAFGWLSLQALGVKATLQGVIDATHADLAGVLPALLCLPAGVMVWHLLAVVLGATVGQRLVGLRLVGGQGAPAGAPRLVLRAVVAGLGAFMLFAGPAFALFLDAKRRGPGDIVAGTVAVKRRP